MQQFSDFVSAFSHHLKPPTRDRSQFTFMVVHPRLDGGIPLHSTVESQQFRSHASFCLLLLRSRVVRAGEGIGCRLQGLENERTRPAHLTARPGPAKALWLK